MAEENKTALSAAQVDDALQTLEGWSRIEAVLTRNFVFHDFEEITAFLNHLVRTITTQNHHPDFSLNTGLQLIFKGYEQRIDNFPHPLQNSLSHGLLRWLRGQQFGASSDFTVRIGSASGQLD